MGHLAVQGVPAFVAGSGRFPDRAEARILEESGPEVEGLLNNIFLTSRNTCMDLDRGRYHGSVQVDGSDYGTRP